MAVGISASVFAVGAIFVWATDSIVSGIGLTTVGWIMIAVGAVGVALSALSWSTSVGVALDDDSEVERRRRIEMER